MNKLVHHNYDSYVTLVFEWDYKEGEPVTALNFKAYQISSVEFDGYVYYGHLYDGHTRLDTADHFVSGFIKWDGCMEWHNLNMHFCGWGRMLEYLMRDIYQQANTIINSHYLLNESFKKYLNDQAK